MSQNPRLALWKSMRARRSDRGPWTRAATLRHIVRSHVQRADGPWGDLLNQEILAQELTRRYRNRHCLAPLKLPEQLPRTGRLGRFDQRLHAVLEQPSTELLEDRRWLAVTSCGMLALVNAATLQTL